MPVFQDLTGKKFGRLTVQERAGKKGGYTMWLCLCECGNTKIIAAGSLKSGHSQSCGCYRREQLRERRTTHGHNRVGKRTKEHRAWANMLQRCTNPRNARYADYGGRGIAVCEAWRTSFAAFIADMGPSPSPKHSIDRIDVNGHYSCGHCEECTAKGWTVNVRWETDKEQANNARSNRRLSFNGKTLTMTQWEDELGFARGTVKHRIYDGWSIERALTEPTERLITFEGKSMTRTQWAKEKGLTPLVLMKRLLAGWTIERALTQPARQPSSVGHPTPEHTEEAASC